MSFFGRFYNDPQVIVQRVFLYLCFKLRTGNFLVEQREFRVEQHHAVIAERYDLIGVRAEIYLIAEVILIFIGFSLLLTFLGSCFHLDLTASFFFAPATLFSPFKSLLLLFLKPSRIVGKFFFI